MGFDAVIVSDPAVFELCRETMPSVPVHLSTQANTTNVLSARHWFGLGVRRIILARELSLDEIREIKKETGGEIEVFVHGALCMAYSGRCLLSLYLADRDANQGLCTQTCRWRYALVEEKRPGEYLPIEEDDQGSYILNSKDLCLLGILPELMRERHRRIQDRRPEKGDPLPGGRHQGVPVGHGPVHGRPGRLPAASGLLGRDPDGE